MEPGYHTARLRKDFSRLVKRNAPILINRFGEEMATGLMERVADTYRIIIPQIQWVGGKSNPLTRNLVGSAQLLALIMELDSMNVEYREIGKIVYDVYQNELSFIRPVSVLIIRMFMKSRIRLNRMLKCSRESKRRRYRDDWVYDYRIVKGRDLLFENTYSQCAICKLYEKLGYGRYLPFLCLLDYATFDKFGLRLERTGTIGNGSDQCDFRIFQSGKNVPGWPPENHAEYKGCRDQG